jgi:hypothetical protein
VKLKKIMSEDTIDDHKKLYGVKAEEMSYAELCPLCNTRIDGVGWCACDTIGGD